MLDTPRGVEVVLVLHLLKICFLLLGVHLLKCFVGLVIQHDQVPGNSQNVGFTENDTMTEAHLLHTLNPDRWSQAFLASKMSSYTTNAVPLVSGVLPTRICLMAPYFPNMSYLQ